MEHAKDRQALNRELLRQDFGGEAFYAKELERYKQVARHYASMENAIVVLSDMRADRSYVYYGAFAETLGLKRGAEPERIASIWEEEIFGRIHPDDLAEKYLQELRFFRFVKRKPRHRRTSYYLLSRLRMRDDGGGYRTVLHRMFYVPAPGGGSMWLSLCLYNPLAGEFFPSGLAVDSSTGQTFGLGGQQDGHLLSAREKEVLRLIAQGQTSRCIAEELSISIHTVSRHRQEILAKLRVRNSLEACRVARELGLIG